MSNTVDWDFAPRKATHYGGGAFWRFQGMGHGWEKFCGSKFVFVNSSNIPHMFTDYQPRPAPQEKPMKYEYGVEYPTNGVKPDLPDDVLVDFKSCQHGGYNQFGPMAVNHFRWEYSSAFRIVDDRYKPATAPVEQTNKYDRTITGKYGTGKCTIDVYRVLAAYDVTDSEVAHAVKKLLAPGQRGVKEERQDIEEAIQSLQAWIARMDDEAVK